jgi:hypothetical protein
LSYISDIREIRGTAIVSEGEGKQKHPEIIRLEIAAAAGAPIEVLCGRPVEETEWLLNRLRRVVSSTR